jgi:hypothetical protein
MHGKPKVRCCVHNNLAMDPILATSRLSLLLAIHIKSGGQVVFLLEIREVLASNFSPNNAYLGLGSPLSLAFDHRALPYTSGIFIVQNQSINRFYTGCL